MRSQRSLTAACRADAPRSYLPSCPRSCPLPLPHPPRTARAPALGNGHPGDAPLVTGHPLSPRCQPFRNEDTRPASILYFIFAPRVERRPRLAGGLPCPRLPAAAFREGAGARDRESRGTRAAGGGRARTRCRPRRVVTAPGLALPGPRPARGLPPGTVLLPTASVWPQHVAADGLTFITF